jgi:cobalamin synthase
MADEDPTPPDHDDRARRDAGRRVRDSASTLVWELTQAAIALSVTTGTMYVAARLALLDPSRTAAFLLLSNAFFLVIGFYFGRTNHQRTGGVGGDSAGAR